MRTLLRLGLTSAALAAGPAALAQDPPPSTATGTLPIRELTVFKDGHSFVLRAGVMPVDAAGNVVLDDLPKPVLGTFWPYCADERAKLSGVVAGRRPVAVERTALGVADLLRANVGAEAAFQEVGGAKWTGKILGFPERSIAEIGATSPPGSPPAPPQPGNVMLVETPEGTKAVAVDRIEGVTIKGSCATGVKSQEMRDRLTMQLAWRGNRSTTANVGIVCLENGLRWIPEYRIDIDGAGRAKVRLEATLVDDLADFDHAAVHLVVGVPKFDFGGELDPIALGADAAELASRMPRSSPFQFSIANSIQTQIASAGDYGAPVRQPDAGALAEGVGGAASNEDLYVFDLADVSLRRGERMTLPVAEFEIPYADVYTVDVPVSPPSEVWRSGRSPEEMERVRERTRPVAMHKVRLEDNSRFPLTTAPAVILRDGRLLGQGRTSYTAPGGKCDVAVTQAVGLRVKKEEHETGRTNDAVRWCGDSFARIDLSGTLGLRNDSDRAYEIEVTRGVLGAVDTSDHDGAVVMVNTAEDTVLADGTARPEWWYWFGWPWWWGSVNGAARVTWKLRIEPHAKADLAYSWHYFWR